MGKSLARLLLAAAIGFVSGSGVAAEGYRFIRLDGHYVKWGEPVMGTGAEVRYAYVSGPVTFPEARNCREMVAMDDLLSASGISKRAFEDEVTAAFAKWEAVADIAFRRVDNPANADILIGALALPVGRAFANVTYQSSDTTGLRSLDRALICFNPERSWKVGFDGNLDAYDLRYTVTHEIGHAIGLDHPGASGQVMAFMYQERFRGLQEGDIRGAQQLYGERVRDRHVVLAAIPIQDAP